MNGLGQHNPDRSEGLWGRGVNSSHGSASPSSWFRHRAGHDMEPRSARRADANLCVARGMPGVGLTLAARGKALPEKPAFQPYWGKPAVRNDRGGGGNVGIIRSPLPRHHLTRPELENLFGDAKGKGTSGGPARLNVPMRRPGSDCSIVVTKRSNARGAKGAGHPCWDLSQLETGRTHRPGRRR